MKRTVVAFAPLLLWAAGVLFVGGSDLRIGASLPSGTDKAAHFAMYGIGGALAAWAGRTRGGVAGWGALAFVLVTGAVDELHQGTLPTRDADLWDWAFDAAGATLLHVLVRTLFGRNDRSG